METFLCGTVEITEDPQLGEEIDYSMWHNESEPEYNRQPPKWPPMIPISTPTLCQEFKLNY